MTLARHRLLVVVDVDLGLPPLAGRDATLEHNVDFAVRAILHLWQTPPCSDQANERRGAPHVTTPASDYAIVSRCVVLGIAADTYG